MEGLEHLLTVYALAVAHLRCLQADPAWKKCDGYQQRLEAAEREVDQLTALHLTPSPALADPVTWVQDGRADK